MNRAHKIFQFGPHTPEKWKQTGENTKKGRSLFRPWLQDIITGDKEDVIEDPLTPPWKTFGEWNPR